MEVQEAVSACHVACTHQPSCWSFDAAPPIVMRRFLRSTMGSSTWLRAQESCRSDFTQQLLNRLHKATANTWSFGELFV